MWPVGVLVFVCTECGNERDASHFVSSMMDMECRVSLYIEFSCDMYMYFLSGPSLSFTLYHLPLPLLSLLLSLSLFNHCCLIMSFFSYFRQS